MIFSDQAVQDALHALGALPQAPYLRQWLSARLLMVPPKGADVGVLKENHGERLLIVELLKALETPESADARDDLATHVHRPREPAPYAARERRRVPDIGPDDEDARAALARDPRRPRYDRRLNSTET